MTNHTGQSNTPIVAAARVAHNGEPLQANHRNPRVLFKSRDGTWLPIDTPMADIPAAPSPQQRLSALFAQAKRLHGEITSLLETTQAARVQANRN